MLAEIGHPASHSLIEITASAIEAVRNFHQLTTCEESCEWLKKTILRATREDGKIGYGNKGLKFWLEDAEYRQFGTPPPGSPQETAIARHAEEVAQMHAQNTLFPIMPKTERPEELNIQWALPAPAACDVCGGRQLLHQQPHISGPRLIPCPKCGDDSTKRLTGAVSR
jgi:hypothetical protein